MIFDADHPFEPTPERLVIVIEYAVHTDMQSGLNAAMARVREGANSLPSNIIEATGVHVAVEDFADRVLDLFAKDAEAPADLADSGKGPWRVGTHYAIHVYEDQRPVATFLTAFDARVAVRDHNAARLNAPAKAPSRPVETLVAEMGTLGQPPPSAAPQDRRARYANAMVAHETLPVSAAITACIDMADAEQREHNVVCIGERNQLHGEVERLTGDLAEARATLARVKALCDSLEGVTDFIHLGHVRAALDAPTEPEHPCALASIDKDYWRDRLEATRTRIRAAAAKEARRGTRPTL
jgi:hypothetical protein